MYINAPEGCQRGTHTNEAAYPLGTYARVHTQTHSSARQSTMRSICDRASSIAGYHGGSSRSDDALKRSS